MDNQQVTDLEFGWLAGIIDGEGCFSMSLGSKGSYNVGIKIVNTNKIIINKVCEIFRKLGLAYHIYDAFRSSNQRPAKRIEINGIKRVERALDILLNYIIAKHEEAIILQQYVKKRLATPYGQMDVVEDLQTYHYLRQLKR